MRSNSKWFICAAFAAGLIVATCLPNSFIIILIAALLVLAGLCLCRY